MPNKLATYHAKRNFRITSEPRGQAQRAQDELRFVVQRHDASKLHYDFRLELDGTLKSWAIPKGPSMNPADKRLAVQVEDHPISYADFEGIIPAHQYGAGKVEIWDSGIWEARGDAAQGYRDGKLKFHLYGDKLHGSWTLVRTRMAGGGNKQQWLLIKERDEAARSDSGIDEEADKPVGKLLKHAPSKPATLQGITITHPERVIDPASGLTKLDLAHYYDAVAPYLLPYLKNRPVYLLRSPGGLTGKAFFQRHAIRAAIPEIAILDPSVDPEHQPLLVINSAKALVSAAQMGTIELHTCNARADCMDKPDCMVFDLDPDPKLKWQRVVDGARLLREFLNELGLDSFVKTSGSKGLHVVVPLARRHTWETVTRCSEAVARHLAETFPRKFGIKMGEQNRVCKIYIDHLRNQKMASTVAPYSVRARQGLSVSTPLSWDELDDVTNSAMWNIQSLPARLKALKKDPWEAYGNTRQTISKAMLRKLDMKDAAP
ncbi:DNA ligase D [Paucimonas lemoignei]|uniref:DNA ligase D n=1 Tax=Paucimonas lemoignei TaxID=29443 RepID=A0A4R3HUP8_PAULE|nr:non-homologous end-joining DNA ligase [Paucimonas lemoignei]TCS33737.1 DNA ligase D [Paucimonas lemoignei]